MALAVETIGSAAALGDAGEIVPAPRGSTTMPHELRVALRRLARSPLFTATAILTLALGLGANTAVFTVLDAVLLEPLPYSEPERLVALGYDAPGAGFEDIPQSPAMHFTLVDEARSFEEVGMWDDEGVAVTGVGEPELVDGMMVTERVLPMLGVEAQLGRIFSAEDDTPGAPRTLLLSHAYWQRRFGGDPRVLGRTLQVDGESFEIIGVLPADFRFLDRSPDLYYTGRFDRAKVILGQWNYPALARLRPAVSPEAAAAEIARLIPVAAERHPGGLTASMLEEARFTPKVHPLREEVVGDVGGVLWVLFGTVALVLVIACANVANLFLVRTEARQRETSLRRALGAGRSRLALHFLGESVLLGLLGGAVGLAFAAGGIRLLRQLGPRHLPRLEEIAIDGEALLFTLALSVLAGLAFGLVPLLRLGGGDLSRSLQDGGRGSSVGRERHRLRAALIVAQVALALVLLVGSGLMLRSFAALRGVGPGFDRPQEVLTFRLFIPYSEVRDELEAAQVYEQIARRVESLPEVERVAIASALPLGGISGADAVEVEGFPVPEGQLPPVLRFQFVSGKLFATLGTPMVTGRPIEWSDVHERRPVAVVSEGLARRYFGEPSSALGKRLRTGTAGEDGGFSMAGTWREIVGVVADVPQEGIGQDPPELVYWPMVMNDFWGGEVYLQRSLGYVIRAHGPVSSGLVEQVRDAVWSVSPRLPVADAATLAEIHRRALARASFTVLMLGIASAVALALGIVGVYGALSYVVSQRTREIGVRMALGAGRGDVGAMIVRYSLVLVGLGVAIGLAAAVLMTRLMAQLLYGVQASDPLTYVTVAAGLGAVALLASMLAARRAAGVDPAEALRGD
jgi:predicted permease